MGDFRYENKIKLCQSIIFQGQYEHIKVWKHLAAIVLLHIHFQSDHIEQLCSLHAETTAFANNQIVLLGA